MHKEERVIVITPSNRFKKIAPREEVRRQNLWHRGAFILIFNSKGEVMVNQRSLEKDVYPGLWEIGPAGTVKAGESVRQTAIRELPEEIGVNVRLNPLFVFRFEDNHTREIGTVYIAISDGPFKFKDGEVVASKFYSPEELNAEIEKNPEKFTPDSVFMWKEYLRLKR